MRYNKTLLAFDLRENPGYTDAVSKKIAIGLLKNIVAACKVPYVYTLLETNRNI
jgi:hypothetical protein